ncbi:MAG: cupin domain-containing protein [Proteobacteria bacterium]|nr:cupin domain-containing protein [Pseudomonadota bacterium]
MRSEPFVVEEHTVALESGEDRGVVWRTLTSADRTPTSDLTSGVCEIEAGCELALHRHPPLELYYFLAGSGIVTLGGRDHPVRPGSTVSIPGNAPHRIRNTGDTVLKLFYVFPTASFSDVEYTTLEGPAAR